MTLKPADFGSQPKELENRAGAPLFRSVTLTWHDPIRWEKGHRAPVEHDEPCLYVLQHEHWKAANKMRILYVGLTISPQTRFLNHKTARNIVNRRGQTFLSYAVVDARGRNGRERTKFALEQLEHLLIWAVDPTENDRKVYTLPGLGSRGGSAWLVRNEGYRFQGQMPREIIYPWMLVNPGRDRSRK